MKRWAFIIGAVLFAPFVLFAFCAAFVLAFHAFGWYGVGGLLVFWVGIGLFVYGTEGV